MSQQTTILARAVGSGQGSDSWQALLENSALGLTSKLCLEEQANCQEYLFLLLDGWPLHCAIVAASLLVILERYQLKSCCLI